MHTIMIPHVATDGSEEEENITMSLDDYEKLMSLKKLSKEDREQFLGAGGKKADSEHAGEELLENGIAKTADGILLEPQKSLMGTDVGQGVISSHRIDVGSLVGVYAGEVIHERQSNGNYDYLIDGTQFCVSANPETIGVHRINDNPVVTNVQCHIGHVLVRVAADETKLLPLLFFVCVRTIHPYEYLSLEYDHHYWAQGEWERLPLFVVSFKRLAQNASLHGISSARETARQYLRLAE
ncbi:hypothetical protein J8273_4387 [Carpediemonas membranifera]|uniref:SET domain-containing protein n=1 Tax=Carpediemonas membranifera TaxID=201153 RepID=A0A8J6AS40_9EUKA|nr:hypothetical protein J8273_5083 [Carpediemonas membranifera]KAG9392653.1 hypothetical protein J8273_6021 [Carpediemonas membranifera]KAG9394026.1 hypothetical protein J8273_4387 [Carpediemonas membranifera]|eukprot:KAG9392109.1 hypothetical protein J8273_5083 [Carpediemonas membranifera]